MRRFILLLAVIIGFSRLRAQEIPGGAIPPAAGPLPLTAVWDAALHAGDGCKTWRPDWPPGLPPDAFKVGAGEIAGCTVESEGVSLAYRLDALGRVKEFPFMLNGRMAHARLAYGPSSEISEMLLAFPGGPPEEDTYRFEFLESEGLNPVLVRVSRGGAWFFILFTRGISEAGESWYDEEGAFLGAYGYSFTEIGKDLKIRAVEDFSGGEAGREMFYDSRGFLTESAGSDGVFKVQYYREDLPRYWERRPREGDAGGSGNGAGKFTLQWDERGFLVRLSREPLDGGPNAEGPPEPGSADSRYEYTLDEKGNWTERREIKMIRRMGLLVPSPGTTFRRVLEYKK
jgi:hypothetical protein